VCAAFKEGDEIVGKTALVTGANRGIGLEFTRQLLEAGNTVVACCRHPSAAQDLQQLASKFATKLHITKLDVTDPDDVKSWAAQVKQLVPHVDVCVNNAGVVGENSYSKWDLDEMDAEEMLFCYKANTIGPLLVVQQLRRQNLIGKPGGSIVGNVTSKVGSVEDNGSGKGYAYRASKAALNIVNKSMSIDLAAEGIVCVLLHPGWVRTGMTEGRGLISAEESAAGLIQVMEGKAGPLNGNWYDYAFKPIPW